MTSLVLTAEIGHVTVSSVAATEPVSERPSAGRGSP